MSGFIKQKFQLWLDKRIPKESEICLKQKRIFIFPTKLGAYFMVVLVLLLLLAINYQNNLIYGLVFLLASMANSAILLSYLNVSGLVLKRIKNEPCYAGDYAACEIELSSISLKKHQRIHLSWPDNPEQVCYLSEGEKQKISLYKLCPKRGIYQPGRLLVESVYPLGFFRCWSWLDLGFVSVVYPSPKPPEIKQHDYHHAASGRDVVSVFADEFYGFRDYQAGDAPRDIHWRSLAKGQELQSKTYAHKEGRREWVDYAALSAANSEDMLSQMCGWALQLEHAQIAWGLRLPNLEIAQNLGQAHLKQALYALAAYDSTI